MNHAPSARDFPVPAAIVAALLLQGCMTSAQSQTQGDWPIHSTDRPQPPVVTPAPGAGFSPPPADALVLFDGSDLSRWRSRDGQAARWRLGEGYFEVVRGTGTLETADGFGDVQLHIEWATPPAATGEGQGRGNSGVFFMGGRYEVQVLDSYQNPTYPDGQAGAVFGQFPPLVNASRPPGEWQSYDIVFRRPRFRGDGSLERPARVTVFHNGILVQDAVELTGPTAFNARPPYEAHEARLPISLQDHGDPVRFRNVWVRRLE